MENKDIIEEVTDFVYQPLTFKAKELLKGINTIQKNVNYKKLKIKGGNMKKYDFSNYRSLLQKNYKKDYPKTMNCLKNILNLKNRFLCTKFCTKQIMTKKKIVN